MYDLKNIGPSQYLMSKQGGMRVPGLIIASETLLSEQPLQALEQVANVAHLPGILGYSIAMPDIHWGYGFPIGGVAAMDVETGVISPGGVGYDINCGVRLAIVPELFSHFKETTKYALLQRLFSLIPSGVGRQHLDRKALTDIDYESIARLGARWSIEQGYGFIEDLECMESRGWIEGASMSAVSNEAKVRGRHQLGTIGSGNHFVEIGSIEEIFLPKIATSWGALQGLTYVLIHSGSRGFGHQICQDTLESLVHGGFADNLPDRQLVCAPIQSLEGKKYFQAMASAANFAFNNRQQILHSVRVAFEEVCHIRAQDIHLLYDVCHNIAKFESHCIDGKERQVCVHRKGATRAFGPGAEELHERFRKTGQPVLIPGDMGRASYLMVGQGNPLTFCSACHGAGRAKSRVQSMKEFKGQDLVQLMQKRGVEVMATSYRTIAEEMPEAYKNVDQVVHSVEEAGLAKIVARLKPHLVIKG
ncbi:MAG: RtcB family protein [Simkania sp.]|nr:RtcB family protein [Simkania sp.]